ncbi:protein canopy homolog 2 isoform X1 [Mobula hypostoma]|uniref:protein canopy homolog 2 isoform X1 n=2 Tax=Mobula hypostoma TaxID=723540 RepID=UPI002FC2DE0A
MERRCNGLSCLPGAGPGLDVMPISVYLILVFGSLWGPGLARRSADLYCGVCRALVDEMEWEISRVNPQRMVETGTFRLDPEGSPVVTQVPYRHSEEFLLELLARVCERMLEYGERTDPGTLRQTYHRVVTREGHRVPAPDTRTTQHVTSSLKQACEKLVEEYEDEFIEFFSRESNNVKDRLCSKRTDLCDHALHIHHDEL